MRLTLAIFVALVCALRAFSSNEEMAQQIRENHDMIYGEGFGLTQRAADQNALADLVSKISVHICSNTGMRIESSNLNGDLSSETAMQMVIDTYTNGHLNNTESLILANAPQAHVMRYISRDEVTKMFESRQAKVMTWVKEGLDYIEECKVSNALRRFYWGFMLVNSLQYPEKALYTDAAGNKHQLLLWLPTLIEDLLADITVKVTEHSENEATLFFTYHDKPIKDLDFTFYNGNGWTPLNTAKNGIACIQLRPGVEVNNLKLRYEYEYLAQSSLDQEVQGLLGVFQSVNFKNSETFLAADASTWKDALSKEGLKQQVATIEDAKVNTVEEVKDRKAYKKAIETIIKGVHSGQYESLRSLFTEDGWSLMNDLLHFGNAHMLSTQQYGFYDLGDDRVVCRSLMMTFDFPNNNRTFTEDVTFTFDADKKIEAVSLGLGAEANECIFDRAIASDGTKIWTDASVMALTTFLENYKTAFALKKLDYLKGVFDDNAVIITGTVMKRPQVANDGKTYMNDMVQYNRYSKEQYMDKLERTFKSQEFVNLRFTDNDVTMMGTGGELFSIQIHQDYYSTTYCDTGYLFLIVDINDPDRPLIKVRTWQPERDPSINGNYPTNHPDWGLIGPGNF